MHDASRGELIARKRVDSNVSGANGAETLEGLSCPLFVLRYDAADGTKWELIDTLRRARSSGFGRVCREARERSPGESPDKVPTGRP
jgi:hypothetical protein